MSKINENVTKLAEVIKGGLKIGAEGVAEVSPELFEKTLEGTELTVDQFKNTMAHRDNLIAATGLALGELGVEHFKNHKDATQVSVEIPVLKDSVAAVFQREKEVQTAPGSGETKTNYGFLRTSYTAVGAANKGELKKVKTHLAEMAAAALKG